MVEVGDRIRLSSMKGPGREGLVTAVTGRSCGCGGSRGRRRSWPLRRER